MAHIETASTVLERTILYLNLSRVWTQSSRRFARKLPQGRVRRLVDYNHAFEISQYYFRIVMSMFWMHPTNPAFFRLYSELIVLESVLDDDKFDMEIIQREQLY